MAADRGALHIVQMTDSHGSTQEWQLAEALFLRALELEPAARTAFIANLPVADAVRLAVLKRLAGHDTSHMLSSLKPGLVGDDPLRPVRAGEAPWMALPADAPYRVGDAIGQDAVASRFRARRTTDDCPVILEFLPMGMAADPAAQTRLRQVAQVLQALAHPHIGVHVDVGDTDEGQLYLVRAGDHPDTLARRMRRMPPLDPEQRGALLDAVRSAVVAAHGVGITHGQLRPEWIVLSADGDVSLYGFGIRAVATGAPVAPDTDEQALSRLTELLQG